MRLPEDWSTSGSTCRLHYTRKCDLIDNRCKVDSYRTCPAPCTRVWCVRSGGAGACCRQFCRGPVCPWRRS